MFACQILLFQAHAKRQTSPLANTCTSSVDYFGFSMIRNLTELLFLTGYKGETKTSKKLIFHVLIRK